MRLRNLWPTPVLDFIQPLPPDTRAALIRLLLKKDQEHHKMDETNPDFHAFMRSKGFYSTSHYNLFDETDLHPEGPAILEFEKYACEAFRAYLREAFQIPDANSVKLVGRCFGNVQTTGARTMPHYHQGIDGVLVHYLELGFGDDPEQNKSPRHGSQALLLMDPRPAPTYPYWEKVDSISPQMGLTVITPGYLWHETNPFRHQGIRACLVVNFQVLTNTYGELHRPMRF